MDEGFALSELCNKDVLKYIHLQLTSKLFSLYIFKMIYLYDNYKYIFKLLSSLQVSNCFTQKQNRTLLCIQWAFLEIIHKFCKSKKSM